MMPIECASCGSGDVGTVTTVDVRKATKELILRIAHRCRTCGAAWAGNPASVAMSIPRHRIIGAVL